MGTGYSAPASWAYDDPWPRQPGSRVSAAKAGGRRELDRGDAGPRKTRRESARASRGPPRAAQDIDLVVDATVERLLRVADALRDSGLHVSEGAIREASATRGTCSAIDPLEELVQRIARVRRRRCYPSDVSCILGAYATTRLRRSANVALRNVR